MSAVRVGSGASAAGRLSGIHGGAASASGIAAPSSTAPLAAPSLTQIRYASTWPRGWMAAAVPQQIREFNTQVSKAQLTLAYVQELERRLTAVLQTAKSQLQLPSVAGLQRAQQALQQLQLHWSARYALTAGSLDECLRWSATQPARKYFTLAGWTPQTLQAQSDKDQELVGFSLLGQEGAHGAWLAQYSRSTTASQFALASALAPLHIQLHASYDQLRMSVPEPLWAVLQARFVVKGNGQRFPAGQWVNAPLRRDAQAMPLAQWAADDEAALEQLQQDGPSVQAALATVRAQVEQFYDHARLSIEDEQASIQHMQHFATAFQASASEASYEWVSAVIPAVRSIARQRVTRLLQARAAG